MSLVRASGAVFARALREGWAGGTGSLLPLGFFFGGVALIPLTVGTGAQTLQAIAPGLLFILLALSALVTLERLFQADVEDGSLDALRLGPLPMEAVALLKVLALWSLSALPILFGLPLGALMLGLSPLDMVVALPAFALASLSFYAWGGVGAALAAGVRRAGLLIALVVLPLYAPAVIFGAASAGRAFGLETSADGSFLFLASATLMAFALGPLAMAQGLRLSSEG